jgi:hypothetical protein
MNNFIPYQEGDSVGLFDGGMMSAESAAYHSAWHPASGHPGGWRVVRSGRSGMQEHEGKTGRRILFKGIIKARLRADELNNKKIIVAKIASTG